VAKWIKLLVGVLLLPVCAGAATALYRVTRASIGADTVWVALAAGGGCWLSIYLLLPKPMWVYVFGHELTHAIWTWLMGGRVKKFKANADGGHVIVTKSNFLIALAPYFFPIYSVGIASLFLLGNRIWNWQAFLPWFHLLLGASYAFHLTLTWHILKSSQTDITEQGYLFSSVVIFLGNVFVLLLAIPVLAAQVTVVESLRWWYEGTASAVRYLAALVH
jgi:hypothetical protein